MLVGSVSSTVWSMHFTLCRSCSSAKTGHETWDQSPTFSARPFPYLKHETDITVFMWVTYAHIAMHTAGAA